jgi:hypothetical protein
MWIAGDNPQKKVDNRLMLILHQQIEITLAAL